MKKIMLFMLAVLLLVGISLPGQQQYTNTAKAEEKSSCETCSLKNVYTKEEVLEKLNELGVIVEDTTKEDQKLVKKLIKQYQKLDKEINKQFIKGFKAPKNKEMFITFKNTHLGGYDYDKVIVYGTLLRNKVGDAVVVSAWVDAKKEELIKYEVGTVTHDNPQEYNSLLSFEKSKTEEGDFTASGFKWNGQSFACSMSGVFACMTYCGVVSAACGPGYPECGAVCDLACGAAFAFACM